jgi:hypothetical protein
MAPRRSLKATPSNPSEISKFQKTLLEDVANLDYELLKAKKPFYTFAQEYYHAHADKPEVILNQLVHSKMAIHAVPEDEARKWALHLLRPREEQMLGLHPTCIVQWRLDDDSMWRGPPDNTRVLRFARSIISSRFRKDSCIASRTLDMSSACGSGVVIFRLLFGDGSARGIAACVVWSLIQRRVNQIPPNDAAVEDLLESLWALPTNFELHGDGSERASLVAQAARQNQAAQTLPVSTIEWIGIVVKHANLAIGSSNATSRAALLRHLDILMQAYNEHPDVESYATEPPAKKLRRKSAGQRPKEPKDPEVEDEGYDAGLKIGNRRILAMRNFLAGATPSGYTLLREHMLWVGDAKLSVISDEVLMRKWFYVGSLPLREESGMPEPSNNLKAEAIVPKGAAFAPLQYNAPLTAKQFDMMLQKAIKVFEYDTSDLERPDLKAKCKPKEEAWMQYRDVVQQWDLAMADVARKDLTAADFQLLENAILGSRSMDPEVMAMLVRRPAMFHIGLLPTCCSGEKMADETARAVHQAHSEAAQGRLKVLEAELQADWVTLSEMRQGHQQLTELLRWLELEHRRVQVSTAERLVSTFLAKSFPVCQVTAWKDLPGQMALATRTWDSDLAPGGRRRAVVLIDFNTPHSRDSLRLPGLVTAVGSLVKVLGPSETVVLAWMPNAPKEGAATSPEEDEAEIVAHFKKEGFNSQTRIRMFFNMHPSVANKTSEMDWWADGRILCQSDGAEGNFWAKHSELARIRRVREEPWLPHSRDLVSIASLNPNEDINQTESSPDLATKYAQRGPGVAEIQLAALFTKVPLQPKDETIIIDPLPFVGDRAVGTYQFMRSAAMENRGRIRHVVVKLAGAGSTFSKAAQYTQQRLKSRATQDWLSRSLVLHETQHNNLGHSMEVAVYPSEVVPPPTNEQLQATPGAWSAHRGLANMRLLACAMRGSKIKILPERLAEFQGAPLDVQDALDRLTATHEAEYENLLSHLVQAADKPEDAQETMPDGRDPDLDTKAELVVHESEETLKATTKITAECKSGHRSVHILKDDKDVFYLVARADDEVLPVGTHIGGVGGGTVLPAENDVKRCWRWSLPAGDKTWVQLSRTANTEDGESKGPKFSGGTLYAIVRELEASMAAPPKMTSFGQLTPAGVAGRHQYTFEFPEDKEGHQAMAFVPTPPSLRGGPTQANNFFAAVLNRDAGVGQGALSVCWRLGHDPVNNLLKPVKPFVVAGKRIVLQKGRPARVAWPA